MLDAEMDEHLGYKNYERTEDKIEWGNYLNGKKNIIIL